MAVYTYTPWGCLGSWDLRARNRAIHLCRRETPILTCGEYLLPRTCSFVALLALVRVRLLNVYVCEVLEGSPVGLRTWNG